MHDSLHNKLPESVNEDIEENGVSVPSVYKELRQAFEIGFIANDMKCSPAQMQRAAIILFKDNEVYQEWMKAGFIYAEEKWEKEEAVYDFMNYKEQMGERDE